VDLGVRVRDLLFRREVLVGAARRGMAGSLSSSWGDPNRAARSMSLIEPFLHTWPLGAMIEDARERWRQGPDGRALAVLARAAEIVSTAVGWPTSLDRRWPMPDPDWMLAQLPEGEELTVAARGPSDGSVGVSVALGVPRRGREPLALPAWRDVPGDEAAARQEELIAALERGDIAAVRWVGHLPDDDATKRAMAALRSRASRQEATDRFGLAGLAAGSAPRFEDLLGEAPAGIPGAHVAARCDAAVVPTLSKEGRIEAVGCLVWDAAYAPVLVVPAAVEVLRRLDGATSAAEIGRELNAPAATIQRVVDQLIGVGAASA
jgi:hypothetical protein